MERHVTEHLKIWAFTGTTKQDRSGRGARQTVYRPFGHPWATARVWQALPTELGSRSQTRYRRRGCSRSQTKYPRRDCSRSQTSAAGKNRQVQDPWALPAERNRTPLAPLTTTAQSRTSSRRIWPARTPPPQHTDSNSPKRHEVQARLACTPPPEQADIHGPKQNEVQARWLARTTPAAARRQQRPNAERDSGTHDGRPNGRNPWVPGAA